MDFKDYVKLAMRTNVPDREFEDNLLNAVLGLIGETYEFGNARLHTTQELNELGDVYWYIALMTHTLGVELKPLRYNGNLRDLCSQLNDILDHIKKHVFQGHPLDEQFLTIRLSKIKSILDKYCLNSLGLNPSKIWEMNIYKLKKRFPEGFDSIKSVNREE